MTPNQDGRDHVFRILALRTDFLSGKALNSALQARRVDATQPLGQYLMEQGVLTEARRVLLDALVDEHIREHGGNLDETVAYLGSATQRADVTDVTEDLFALLPNAAQSTETIVPADPWSTGDGELKVGPPPVTTVVDSSADPLPGIPPARASEVRYRLLRPLARGGLGDVFIAHDEDLKREVALKQIRERHAHDPRNRSRFLAEAEITGHLEHPGIVPIYGLGTYEDGRPYYAMRLIRGVTLGKAIQTFHEADRAPGRDPNARALELRKLLQRFIDVCNAITYAHSRGVIHRDLKPDNIMLGKYGETLVVDWGLAKMMESPITSESGAETAIRLSGGSGSHVTLAGSAVGTPSYMSPEQAAGALDRIGPRSDVYSLGATLYTILVGKPPFGMLTGELDNDVEAEALRNRVCRGEFPHPRAVDPEVPRPLEAICLKAMATDPQARYPTPRALADDLDRWLAGAPVLCWREPASVRTGRWLARHRTLMTVVAASTLIALIGAATVGVVASRANRRLIDSNRRLQVANKLALDAIHGYYTGASEDLLLKQPQFEDLRGRLLRAPLNFFKRLMAILEQDGSDARTRASFGEACMQVATINSEIGSQDDAVVAYRLALPVYEQLTRDEPDRVEHTMALARCHDGLAAVEQATARTREAQQSRRRALELWMGLEQQRPTDPAIKAARADCLRGIALLQSEAGAHAEALKAFGEAEAILERLVNQDNHAFSFESDLAECLISLGVAQGAAGRKIEALQTFRDARGRIRTMADRHADAPELRRAEARCLLNIAQYQIRTASFEEALTSFNDARRILERLVETHPVITRYQRDLAACQMGMMWPLRSLGRQDDAQRSFDEALKIVKGLIKLNPDVTEFQETLAWCYGEYGLFLKDLKRWDESLDMLNESTGIIERLIATNSGSLSLKTSRVLGYFNIGDVLFDAGRPEEAVDVYEKARGLMLPLLEKQSDHPDLQHLMGVISSAIGQSLVRLKRLEQARGEFETAITHESMAMAAEPQSEHFRRNLDEQYGHLIAVYRSLNRPAKLAETAVNRQRLWPGDAAHLVESAIDLARCIPMVGRGKAEITPAERAERTRYADQSMTALRAAVTAGFRDVKRLGAEPALEPLRLRADFELLMRSISP